MVATRRFLVVDHGYSPVVRIHVDLVRNDYRAGAATVMARIHLVDGGYGLAVENLGGVHCEANVFAALGEMAGSPASEIVATLARLFHGPYLVASEPHSDDDCPFEAGPLPIATDKVVGEFRLSGGALHQ